MYLHAHLCCRRAYNNISSQFSSYRSSYIICLQNGCWMQDKMTMLESVCGSVRDSHAVWKCHTPRLQLELLIKPMSRLQVFLLTHFLLLLFLSSFCVLSDLKKEVFGIKVNLIKTCEECPGHISSQINIFFFPCYFPLFFAWFYDNLWNYCNANIIYHSWQWSTFYTTVIKTSSPYCWKIAIVQI